MILSILLLIAFLIILKIYLKKNKPKDCKLDGTAVKKETLSKKIKK